MCVVSEQMSNPSNNSGEEFDSSSLAMAEGENINMDINMNINLDSSTIAVDADSTQPDAASPDSSHRSSPLTYHDHFDVKEEDMGDLVRQHIKAEGEGGACGVGAEVKVEEDAKPPALDETHAASAASADVDDDPSSKAAKAAKRKSTSGPRGGVYEPFPLKLHRMLATVEEARLTSAVSWKSHGRAFQVNHVNQFVQTILPKFFRQTKLTSFQRQLNLYGFRRIIHGTDSGAYYHELFLRGKPFLCRAMVRTKVKGKSRLRAADLAGSEPDFYKMKPLPMLTEDDYKKSKNVFLSGDHMEGEESSLGFSVGSNSTSKKRRSSPGMKGFDPFNPFPDQEIESTTSSDHHHFRADPMCRPTYQGDLPMFHRDRSTSSLPPNYSMSSTSWNSRVDEMGPVGPHHMISTMSTSLNSPQMAHHTGNQMGAALSDRPMVPPQSMYGMPSSSAHQMGPSPVSGESQYDDPRYGSRGDTTQFSRDPQYGRDHSQYGSMYHHQQNSYTPQNQYYPPPQYPYQYHSSDRSGYQYEHSNNPYNFGSDNASNRPPPTSPQRSSMMPNASREPFNAQYPSSHQEQRPLSPTRSSPPGANLTLAMSTLSSGPSHESQSAMSSVKSSAIMPTDRPTSANINAASGFAESMSPIKNTSQSGAISLEVDGDMKEILHAFINKKEK